MIEKYLEILKEPEGYNFFDILELARRGSQTAFDAILELKRQTGKEFILSGKGANPFHLLMILYDKGQLRENYKYFKENLDLLIRYDPCFVFSTGEFFQYDLYNNELQSFLNLNRSNSKINNYDFAQILKTMLCKTKFTEKYEKNFELYKTLDNYACIFDIMLRKGLCSFLNDNESYNGQSSYGKNTHLLDIKQSKLFDFVHLFKDNIGHKLLSYDGDNNFLLENHSLNLSEIVGDDKILAFQFSDNQKEKERIEDTVRFTHNLLNNCYRRWDCWHSILLQSIQIHLDDYDPLPGNGLFEGVQMFNSNELSEIGKMLVGASLKVVELGSIFIKKLKSEFKDPFSNVYEMEKHIFVQDLLIFDLEKIYNIILGMEEFSHRHAEYFKSFEEYKKLYDS